MMWPWLLSILWCAAPSPPAPASAAATPTVTVDRDNVEITQSCIVAVKADHIVDGDGNGVIHITADDIVVDFQNQRLHGATANQLADTYAGTGIVITGKNVILQHAHVSGFRVGIHAVRASGLRLRRTDVSNNYHQRLHSTLAAEDASDWLWPHQNDRKEWMQNYGAGVYVEESGNVELQGIRARKTQNGIILDRVEQSKVFDCDCSFLSGWGLALWRSSENYIVRNAFDFCVRGYSHGVYNRGQDSAGILLFEQCNANLIAENSCTHSGDGLFGFAGKEALGESITPGTAPGKDAEWYRRRGCNDNIIFGNDFSFAVAHGLEMTFSFGNTIWKNRFMSNAICGVWGGYSCDTTIVENHFEGNGDMAYGLERGGVNIEHGQRNVMTANVFRQNACAIHLWWDDDQALLKSPWAAANGAASDSNRIISNTFENNKVGVQLRHTTNTRIAPMKADVAAALLVADAESKASATILEGYLGGMPAMLPDVQTFLSRVPASSQPVGARRRLAGRQNIIMTEWGPWDHESPLLQLAGNRDHGDKYRVLGVNGKFTAEQIDHDGDVFVDVEHDSIVVRPRADNTLLPYAIALNVDGHRLQARGTLTGGTWEVRTFKSACDPRADVERWRREGAAEHHVLTAPALDFRFGTSGMSEARGLPVKLPHDHFGVIATRSLTFPAGKWRLKTTSDDGIRVWMNEQLVIDDWTHHGPTRHDHEFAITEEKTVDLRIEYFELDGYAVLAVDFEPIELKPRMNTDSHE